MVGNDIVDLQVANRQSRWEDARFVDKIFTQNEKSLIANSNDKFVTIWRLWSMKESAYKIYIQQKNKPFYNPKKIETQIIDGGKGLAYISNLNFKTITKQSSNYIYTIAESLNNKQVLSKEFDIRCSKISCFCQQQLINFFRITYNLKTEQLIVKKNDKGVPQLYCDNVLQQHSLSITHHGKYAAICFN